uniref:Uncharacterized protein n=1 Tax=Moniliophthora roreri TaxID=221103 RepID=A0A0W0FS80_MONRR
MAPAVLSGRKRNLWNKLVDIIQVPQGQFVFEGNRWGNHDLDPTPPEERKWTAWLYASFWAAHAANACDRRPWTILVKCMDCSQHLSSSA